MKRTRLTAVALLACVAAGAAAAQEPGSNVAGQEKICYVAPPSQDFEGLPDVLRECRRGDILLFSQFINMRIALALCDFNRAVVIRDARAGVWSCMYTGFTRNTINMPAK